MAELIHLEEATLIKDLKPLILTDIRALYGPQNPSLQQYDIITSGRVSYLNNQCYSYVTAHAIVYTKPGTFAQWKLLLSGAERDSVSGALKSLWMEVQSKGQVVTGFMQLGDLYRGSKGL